MDDTSRAGQVDCLEERRKQVSEAEPANPFYSPDRDSVVDETYQYNGYKPHFPVVNWEPLKQIEVIDRGQFADPEKKALLSAAKKVQHLTPAIGTEILGIDLRQLTPAQKDELALLVAERGVVFFRNQELNIHEQLAITRYFGPLHKHAATPVPKEPGLEEVHVVYNDVARRPDSTLFSKLELWHSDVTYELQPPSTTSLKVITSLEYGGDTVWSSGYAINEVNDTDVRPHVGMPSTRPGLQTYLEGLSALHSAVAQADGARAAGLHVRREPVETVHPVIRVHPVTGWKSVYVNPVFTRRIVDVPRTEPDAILGFLFEQMSSNIDFHVRFRWETDSVAFWDNRIVTHSAMFDFWPERRHALRATPHGERPESVQEYERRTGKVAKDRQIEVWRQQGIEPQVHRGISRASGYND